MRFSAVALVAILTSWSGMALAAPSLDLTSVPARCSAVASVPRSTRSADPVFAARISAATCMVDVALAGVPLRDDDASIRAVDTAVAPILASLDEVVAHGTPEWKAVALYMKSDLLFGFEVRLRATIPAITARTSLADAQALERRHTALESKLEPWDARARAAVDRVVALARENPGLAHENPALAAMLGRAELTAAVVNDEARTSEEVAHHRLVRVASVVQTR
ncbi:MAG TPA: hypothetical protein VMI54_27325 [Polyangiaceae bacterium]|nr:hypothetical protein [Polyangiaceae bacterium]